jgi:polyisoprenoid-binding protein YceI
MSISGRAITDLVVTVDMTTLTSDEDRRDMSLRDRGLETSTFPQASFTLTEPIVLDHRPAVGETIKPSPTGDLLLHGVTRSVTVPVEARRTDSEIEVAASFDVTLANYDIEAPVGFAVLSVADTGTVEMHLLFARS